MCTFLRSCIASIALVPSLVALPSLAPAQSPATHYAHPLEVNLHVGALVFDSDLFDGDTEVVLGARAIYNLPVGLGLGGSFDWVPVDAGDVYLASGHVEYTFGSPTRLHFFVLGGLGALTFSPDEGDSESELLVPIGVGFKWFDRTHASRWAFRAEVRDDIVRFDDPDTTTNNVELSGGVSLLF